MAVIKNNESIKELPYWLALSFCARIGPIRLQKLAIEKHYKLSDWFCGQKPTPALLRWFEQQGIAFHGFDWSAVEQALAWAGLPGNSILTLVDTAYPHRLRHIPAPPPVLYVKGQARLLNHPQIGIVGSRHPSAEGLRNAYGFAKQLSASGIVVTSGLALGIDGASHEGALAGPGPTIAVLGSGLNQIYPKRHCSLANKITSNGALVSELPIYASPQKEFFPRRNRIISGLSVGVLVVEAAKKSGSLITANYAIEQGREVFALPGSIHNPLAKGCHELIRQGAMCVDEAQQMLEALSPLLTDYLGDASIKNSSIKSYGSNICIQEELFT